ncbi:MAG TPA: adenylate/guanylate cyclase domain-containing protein [Gaiellaceae bacterium]|nr:adenylate/guanylate cyclase domain-containing protein [Gaiellaceae bacterium]
MVELPAGTVTFLFSDIEGSTRLLEQLGDRYADVHREHRRILREQLGGAGGREIDTQGDAFFFSFPRAKDAAAGAVAAQRALAEHRWPDGAEVKVRMGLHTGEPTVGEEGYLGMDVVRAARICSAGHGGQILLSETTRALLGNSVPDGTELRDLGEAALKDVQHERIYQLALPEQRAEFPPLKVTAEKSAAERLEEEIERKVHEQILAAFEPGPRSGDDSVSNLGKLVLVGFLAVFLSLCALAAIVLLISAVL